MVNYCGHQRKCLKGIYTQGFHEKCVNNHLNAEKVPLYLFIISIYNTSDATYIAQNSEMFMP